MTSSFAGAWGTPRNRHTRTVQPGQTGGMNARGSIKTRSANQMPGEEPPGTVGAPVPVGGVQYGNSNPQAPTTAPARQGIFTPSFADARYQKNVADLVAALEQKQSETKLNLKQYRSAYQKGIGNLRDQRGLQTEQMYGQLGAANAGRSGAATMGQQDIQSEYDRNLDELSRQFGTGPRKLMRDLLKQATDQFYKKMQAESATAAERQARYEAAGEEPLPFTPSEDLYGSLGPKKKK